MLNDDGIDALTYDTGRAEIARSGPLTFAQQKRWLSEYWRRANGTARVWTSTWAVEPPAVASIVEAAARRVADRHDILRTLFTLDRDSEPRQTVVTPGSFRAPISWAPDDLDTRADGRSERESAQLPWSTMSASPLWHMVIQVSNGMATSIRIEFAHIVTDGPGAREWRRQLEAAIAGSDEPASAIQPLDRLGPAPELDQAVADNAGRVLLDVPQALLPAILDPADTHTDRKLVVPLEGLWPGIDEICHHAGTARVIVVKFAISWFLARYTGRDAVLVADVISPRATSHRGIDCQIASRQCVVELPRSATFIEALDRLTDVTLASYDDGGTDHDIVPKRAAAQGIGGMSPVYFNFLAEMGGSDLDGSKAPPEPKIGPLEIHEIRRLDDCFAPVVSVYSEGPTLLLEVQADERILPTSAARLMGPAVVELVKVMRTAPDATIGSVDRLLPDRRCFSGTMPLVRGCWFDAATLTHVLRSAGPASHAEVELADGLIVARLTVEPATSAFDIHEHVLDHAYSHRGLIAPDRYDLFIADQRSPDPNSSWSPRQQPFMIAPETKAERALCDAISTTHGFDVPNICPSYAEIGGRQIRAPAVAEILRGQGYEGLRREHFAAPYTLRSVARRLRPRGDSPSPATRPMTAGSVTVISVF